jgi:hypothetical protein
MHGFGTNSPPNLVSQHSSPIFSKVYLALHKKDFVPPSKFKGGARAGFPSSPMEGKAEKNPGGKKESEKRKNQSFQGIVLRNRKGMEIVCQNS